MAVSCSATPSELYLEKTRPTIQFAARVKLVKTNAKINKFIDQRIQTRKPQIEMDEDKRAAASPKELKINHNMIDTNTDTNNQCDATTEALRFVKEEKT